MRNTLTLSIVATLAIATTLWAQAPRPQASPRPTVGPTWEYKSVAFKNLVEVRASGLFNPTVNEVERVTGKLEAELTALGSQGWELCLETSNILVFKRPR